jgi:RNA polymerase sigma factor (TIGR02999 family)
MSPKSGTITHLLRKWGQGDREAFDQLMPLVYGELKRLAGYYLRREQRPHTLQSTALVHEVYLRLVRQTGTEWEGRRHFFAVASQVLRHVLVDHSRRRLAAKRDGGERVPLEEAAGLAAPDGLDLGRLDESLECLAALDPQKARVVELRLLGGFSVVETSGLMGISTATVKRHWAVARLWLCRELAGNRV